MSGLYTATGVVAARYRYDPWGAAEYEMPGSVENPLRYTGREWDAETGLYYYRARYYDPQIGRFISEDPIGLAGGINAFVYAWNDPVNLRDPSGLMVHDPCPRDWWGRVMGYAGLCEWDMGTVLDEVVERAHGGFDHVGAREGARELDGWRSGPVGRFFSGAASYPRGIYRFGRHAARRYGWMGECEQQMVAVEDALVQQALQMAVDNPGETLDLVSGYVGGNKARVAGRLGTGALVSYVIGPLGLGLGLASGLGDARHQAESMTATGADLFIAAVGGQTSGPSSSVCGS